MRQGMGGGCGSFVVLGLSRRGIVWRESLIHMRLNESDNSQKRVTGAIKNAPPPSPPPARS